MTTIRVDSGREIVLEGCPVEETEDSYSVQEIYEDELWVHIVAKDSEAGKAIADYMEVTYGVKRFET